MSRIFLLGSPAFYLFLMTMTSSAQALRGKFISFIWLISLFSFFYFAIPAKAQDHIYVADSLYKSFVNTEDQKTKLEILTKLLREIHYSDSAQPYYLQAIALVAKEQNNLSLLAENLNRLGVYYRNKNLQDEALLNYEEALAISQRANNPTQIGHSLNSIGQIYYYQGLYEEALKYYLEAAEYFQSSGDLQGLAYNLTGKSLVLGALGEYQQAIEAVDAAISIRSTNGNNRQLIVSKFNKAQLLIDMGDLNAARQDVLALYAYGKENDYFRAIQALEKLVEIDFANRSYASLKAFVEEALKLHQERPNSESIITILSMALEVAKLENDISRQAELEELLESEKKAYNTQKTRDYLAKLTIQRQKREIEQLNRENELILQAEKFQSYIFFLLFTISVILFILVIVYRRYLNYHRELNQELKVQKIKMEVQAEELSKTNQIKDKILRILSHDLREPLHSL